jgi:putative ABC transport system substrate-binding protein
MNRRDSLAALAALVAAPALRAQPPRMFRVAILMYGSAANATTRIDAFIAAMKALGYEQGRNIVYDRRMGNGQDDLLLSHARELAKSGVDVIVSGSAPATQALHNANTTVPIVMAAPAESAGVPDHVARHMEILLAVAPRISRVTALVNPQDPSYPIYHSRLRAIGTSGPAIVEIPVTSPAEIEAALGASARDSGGGLIVTNNILLYNERRTIAEMAARSRRPAIYPVRGFVEVGGLMSWGPNPEANFARAATHVDHLLRGGSPTETAPEPPAKLELVVSREALRGLSLTLPADLARNAVLIG